MVGYSASGLWCREIDYKEMAIYVAVCMTHIFLSDAPWQQRMLVSHPEECAQPITTQRPLSFLDDLSDCTGQICKHTIALW